MAMNTLVREPQLPSNPIDILEELVISNDWPFTRSNDSELAVEVGGRWCSYQLCFLWDEASQSVHFSSFIDTRVPREQRPAKRWRATAIIFSGRGWTVPAR